MKRILILLAAIACVFVTCKKDSNRSDSPSYGEPTSVEWTSITGEPGKFGESLLFTADENLIVSGSRDDDVLIFKADTACKILWELKLGTLARECALKTVETAEGDLICLASRNYSDIQYETSYVLYYISREGIVTDSLTIDGSTLNYVADMELADDGGVLLAGSKIPDGADQIYSTKWSVMKLTSKKDLSWKKDYIEEEELIIHDLGIAGFNQIHLCASVASDDRQVVLFRCNHKGDLQKRIDFSTEYNSALRFDGTVSSLLCGYIPFDQDGNAYIASHDLNGGLLWEYSYEVNPWDSSYNPIRFFHPIESGFIAFGSSIYLFPLVNAMSDMTAWVTVFDQSVNPQWHIVWTPADEDRPCNFMIHSVEYIGDDKCILLGEGILDYPCADENEIFIIPINAEGFIYPTTPTSP